MKNKIVQWLKVLLGVALSASLVGGVLANTESSAKDSLINSLANHLERNPNNELARLLAEFLLNDSKLEAGLGVLDTQPNKIIGGNLVLKDSDSQTYINEGWEEIDFPATASTTVKEANQTGKQVIVDYAEIEINGTVSSTVNMYVGVVSSTASNLNINPIYSATTGRRPSNLIDGTQFVTSTAITQNPTTVYRFLRNSWEDQGTNGVQAIPMTTSSYIVWFAQADAQNGAGCGNGTGGDFCEQVTSSARGWTAKLRYKYHFREVR